MSSQVVLLTVALLGLTPPAIEPGRHSRTIEHGGLSRSYHLYVPKSYNPKAPTPLVVVALHPFATTAKMMEAMSGLSATAERAGFVVVYPNGTGRAIVQAWNVGAIPSQKVDDIGFLRRMLDEIETLVNVDKARVYATGMSNGGMMCYKLASEMSDRIAAIAAVAGTMTIRNIQAKRSVPVLHIHGTADTIVPFEGFRKSKAGFSMIQSVDDTVRAWVEFNGCPARPKLSELPDAVADGTRVMKHEYGPGKDGAEVVLYMVQGGGHTWPGKAMPVPLLGKASKDVSASDLIWDFFNKHPLPSPTIKNVANAK